MRPLTESESTEFYHNTGTEIANFLRLKFKDGRVNTGWGTKSAEGLARSIERIIEEQREKMKGVKK